jgi:hypothetical protein
VLKQSASRSIDYDYGAISFFYLTKTGTTHTISLPAIILGSKIETEEIAGPTRLRFAILVILFF